MFFSVAEPKSGFEIAFNMFDIDGNKRVDIDEFKVVCNVYFYEIFSYVATHVGLHTYVF